MLFDTCLSVSASGIPSIADKHQTSSREIARRMVALMGKSLPKDKAPGQSAGNQFEGACEHFLAATFPLLEHLRPGKWEITKVSSRRGVVIAQYQQYAHLLELDLLAKANETLASALGTGYAISPDVVILRHPEPDEALNAAQFIVDERVAMHAGLREKVNALPILHASISCKLTIRSDRAQNARSEALSFLRNRNGRAPHIVVITAEPTPSRISSLALGTGDLDCVYHIALPELISSAEDYGNDEAAHLLRIMVEGQRLKDIADLPLDLVI
jgi:hypothetical protein